MSDEIKNEIATEQDETATADETLEKEGILSDQEEKKAQKKGKKPKSNSLPNKRKNARQKLSSSRAALCLQS